MPSSRHVLVGRLALLSAELETDRGEIEHDGDPHYLFVIPISWERLIVSDKMQISTKSAFSSLSTSLDLSPSRAYLTPRLVFFSYLW